MRIELLPSRERGACALERGAHALNVDRLVGPYELLDDSSGIERGVVAFRGGASLIGALCFVLCALCFVLCALCFLVTTHVDCLFAAVNVGSN